MYKKKLQLDCLGMILFLSIFFSIFISGLFWLVGLSINAFVFPLALIASYACAYQKFGSIKGEIAASIVLILCCILTGAFLPDTSWDGQAYHQPGIYALSHGWNPIYQFHQTIFTNGLTGERWIDHYAKGLETAEAAIVALTGNLESGKAINFIFALSAFFYLIPFLKGSLSEYGISSKRRIFYAFLLAFPNIFFSQFLTFYIDYAAYYIILWMLMCFINLYKKVDVRLSHILIFSSIFMAATIKFNMFFWVGYATFFYLIFLFLKKRYLVMKRLVSVCLVSIITALLTSGFNPYITNLIDHHNPIYPLGVSSDNIEYLSKAGISGYLAGKGRIWQAVESLFSRPNNDSVKEYIPIYQISSQNIVSTSLSDTRLGGGGFFFVDLFVITLFVLFLLRKGKCYSTLLFFSLITFSVLFILPFGSLHRYVPYIYLIPIATLIYIDINYPKKWLSYLYSLLLVLNVFITCFTVLTYDLLYKYSVHYYISQIRLNHIEVKTKNWSFIYKLNGNKFDTNDVFTQTADTIGQDGYLMPMNRCFKIYLKDNKALNKPYLIEMLEKQNEKRSNKLAR